MIDWTVWLDNLNDPTGSLPKETFKALIQASIGSNDEFVKKQATKITSYFQQLALGTITKEDFISNIEDIHELFEMKISENKIADAAAAQKLADSVKSVVLDVLAKII